MRTRCGVSGWRFGQLEPEVRARAERDLATRLAALAGDDLVDRSEVLLTGPTPLSQEVRSTFQQICGMT